MASKKGSLFRAALFVGYLGYLLGEVFRDITDDG